MKITLRIIIFITRKKIYNGITITILKFGYYICKVGKSWRHKENLFKLRRIIISQYKE